MRKRPWQGALATAATPPTASRSAADEDVRLPWWDSNRKSARRSAPDPTRARSASTERSPGSNTRPPAAVTRNTKEASLPRQPASGGGHRLSTRRPSRSSGAAPAPRSTTGTPRSRAACSTAAKPGASRPPRGSHSRATGRPRRMAGAPPRWSRSACVRTSRSRRSTPRAASAGSTASRPRSPPGKAPPASTRIAAPGLCTSTASPWPTSRNTTRGGEGASGRGGASASTRPESAAQASRTPVLGDARPNHARPTASPRAP